MLSPQAHISTPPPYHTHHQTNSCFLWFIHLKQAKTVSQSTFGFQGSLRLAWHHATINHLQMTDDTLELRAADMPVPAQDMRQIPFVCLFFISCHSAHHCAICAKQHLGRPDPKIHTTPSVPQLDNAGHLWRSQWTAWQVQRLLCMFVGQSDTNLLRTWASASRIHLLWRKLRHRMRNEKSHSSAHISYHSTVSIIPRTETKCFVNLFLYEKHLV